MFGSIDDTKGLLFVTYDLDQVLRATMDTMRREVKGPEANRLLNTAPEDLKRYLVEAHGVASRDQGRWIDDRSRPVPIAGERVEVRVPFQGESELFFARANTFNMNPPRAVIERNKLVLRYDTPADQARDKWRVGGRTLHQNMRDPASKAARADGARAVHTSLNWSKALPNLRVPP